jgi:chemotaxis protein CheD
VIGASGKRHNIVQGEFFISDDPSVMISTILGSCVAACMRDPVAGVGGMNHFLLPGDEGSRDGSRYGAYLMELLINGLLARGARRERLEAKLFGGARMLNGLTDIGSQNAMFAERFLAHECIAYKGGSLGGDYGRRIHYWPGTGSVNQQRLVKDKEVFVRERAPRLAPVADDGELELFG